MDTIALRPLTTEDWPAIETLFGANGACGGCWCMAWRARPDDKGVGKGAPNKRRFKAMIAAGEVHGILAFAGDQPVGWCSIGPRDSFPRLARARSLKRDHGPATWSVTCFFIARGWRRRGLAGKLLAAATREAFRRGAKEVEGYPASAASIAASATFAWTGVASLFEDAGFDVCPRPGQTRPLYLKARA